VHAIASGDFHMLALTRDRRVFSWGYGGEGQCGHGGGLHLRTPRPIDALRLGWVGGVNPPFVCIYAQYVLASVVMFICYVFILWFESMLFNANPSLKVCIIIHVFVYTKACVSVKDRMFGLVFNLLKCRWLFVCMGLW
jgi:hypothetical protein